MRLRRTAVAALLAAGIVVPAVGTAAVAQAQPATKTATAQKATPKASKTKKPVRTRFEASGRVTAVDAAAGTVTLLVSSGHKGVRKQTVTVTVPSTVRVRVNGKRKTLAAVTAGARITVHGIRVAAVYTAAKVSVTQKRTVVAPGPSPTAAPIPTVVPTPGVEPTPTVEPTPSSSPSPIEDPTEEPADEDLSA